MKQAVLLRGTIFALFALLVMQGAFLALRSRIATPYAPSINLELLPRQLGDWTGVDSEGLSSMARGILQLDHAVRRTYSRQDGASIDLYIGYWKHQSGDHQAAKHSPAVCLPANGWNIWDIRANQLEFPSSSGINSPPLAFNSISAQFARQDHLFYYWFFSGERTYANEWTALFFITLEKFLKNRSDGGIVELSTPMGARDVNRDSLKQANERLTDFTGMLHPALMNLINN